MVDRAYEQDPESARAEYGAEFRSDIEAFVSREVVEGCVIPGVLERPPARALSYQGFVDPSGGIADSMTLCIGHTEGDTSSLTPFASGGRHSPRKASSSNLLTC